jgi:hypothetical protein
MGHGGHSAMSMDAMDAMVRDMRNRFIVAAVLSVPILLWSSIGRQVLHFTVPAPLGLRDDVFQLILSLPVIGHPQPNGPVITSLQDASTQMIRVDSEPPAGGQMGVGREGFEPPQISRVVYSHLSSPMPSRPSHGCRHPVGGATAIVPAQADRPTA